MRLKLNSMLTVEDRQGHKNHGLRDHSSTSLHGDTREDRKNYICLVFIRKLPSLHENKSVALELC